MRAKLNHKEKMAAIECVSIGDAGWLGFTFAHKYTHLVADGWLLYFYGENDPFFLALEARAESISQSKDLAEKIKKQSCCHNCSCDKGK